MPAHAHAVVRCPPGTGTSPPQQLLTAREDLLAARHRPGRCSCACSPDPQPFPAQSCSPVIWAKKLTSEGRWPTWPELHLEAGLAAKLVRRRARRGKQEGGPEARFQSRFSAHPACALQGSQLWSGRLTGRQPGAGRWHGRGARAQGEGKVGRKLSLRRDGLAADLGASLEAGWLIPAHSRSFRCRESQRPESHPAWEALTSRPYCCSGEDWPSARGCSDRLSGRPRALALDALMAGTSVATYNERRNPDDAERTAAENASSCRSRGGAAPGPGGGGQWWWGLLGWVVTCTQFSLHGAGSVIHCSSSCCFSKYQDKKTKPLQEWLYPDT